jgi:hypothetical protein
MLTSDPVTFFVASSVMPTAVTAYLFWSAYLMAVSCPPRRETSRRPIPKRRL